MYTKSRKIALLLFLLSFLVAQTKAQDTLKIENMGIDSARVSPTEQKLLLTEDSSDIIIVDTTKISPIDSTGISVIDSLKTTVIDTVVRIQTEDIKSIPDILTSFNNTNKSYHKPRTINKRLLKILNKDKIELSADALYWINWTREPSTIVADGLTFKDTCIFNPLFLPLVFNGGLIDTDNIILHEDTLKKIIRTQVLYQLDTTLFIKEKALIRSRNDMFNHVRINRPDLFKYAKKELPTEIIQTHIIKKETYEPTLTLKIEKEPNIKDVDAPVKFLPERRYWTSNFESSMQFAQAYFSDNWFNGQQSNINMNTRNYFRYTYNKDKVRLLNELEIRFSANNAPKDTVRSISVTGNNIRLHTNFGYQAFARKWYYSIDCTINTPFLNTYRANDTITRLTGFLAPMKLDLGIGMTYNLNKTLKGKPNRRVNISITVSPLSLTYRYSRFKERFDFGRHGFDRSKKDEDGNIKTHQHHIGSDFTTNLTFQFNKTTRWTSRFNYNTSYHKIFFTFDNRVEFAVGRFFSTQINLNFRYDDFGKPNKDFKDIPLQISESLTFGFSYRW